MFKKITAICLAFILVISMAIIPVFASDNQNGTTTENQASIIRNDKKDKDDKDNDNDYKDLLEDVLKKFLDSDEFDWAQKSIEKMGYMGILNGTGNGYFQPKNNVTHAEAIAMVLKLTGYQDEAEAITVEPKYFKGNSDKWSYGYLQLALDKGIIIPSEDGSFNPRTPAKRHEVAKYVVRALGERSLALKNMKTKLNYTDASSIPAGSVGYVYVVTNLGIMQGSNNQFQPNKPITRAELAVILDNAESKTEEPSKTSSSAEGKFVKFDEANMKITLNVNNESVVYDVTKNAPVYKNSKYYSVSSLEAGDVIRVTLDNQQKIIFIELIQNSTTEPTDEALSIKEMQYSLLPQAIKDKVDTLKESKSFTAFVYDENIYLIAARGEMPTGGYTIDIEEVYKETVGTDEYNLKVVVAAQNPGSSVVTQEIAYPYTVVKLSYFDDINKVNFVNTSDTVLAQTTIKTIDVVEVIEGTVNYINASDRKIKLLESDDDIRTYIIPSDAIITLDGKTVRLSSIAKDMFAAITITDGKITKLAVQSEEEVTQTISGEIYSVDTTNKVIKLLESDGVKRSYSIPTGVRITLDGRSVTLSALKPDMPAVITKFNGEITKLTAQSETDVIETINGKIDSVDTIGRIVRILESDNSIKSYYLPSNVLITLNNRTASLSSLIKDMPVVLTRTNSDITKLAATNTTESINGRIDSVDTTARIVKILESDNHVRSYYIPSNVTITLNNRTASLSTLAEDMTVVLTRTNGVITKLAATNIVETIKGKIDSLNTNHNLVKLLESNNAAIEYTIPDTAQITLDNKAADFLDLKIGMKAEITKVNGVITKLAVQRDIQTIEGILITTYTLESKTYISVKVGTVINAYEITSDTKFFYKDASSNIESIPFNSTLIIKIENAEVIEVRNK